MEINIVTKEDIERVEELLRESNKKIERMEMLLCEILSNVTKGTVTVKDVSTRTGLSVSRLYNNNFRHYLPNFGKSDFPDGVIRWEMKTYEAWSNIPISKRKERWDNMSKAEREEIVKKAG